ncbi:MAG TPA: hypothetical protein PLW35_04560 [Verrucomicrobiota bacterium]|nr:hypothetical protein [Verrucomicrobiota bacterium]
MRSIWHLGLKTLHIGARLLAVASIFCAFGTSLGVVYQWYPDQIAEPTHIFNGWPTVWNPLVGVNDGRGDVGTPALDFVGDSSNPGGYWAADSSFVFFRVRVAYSGSATPTKTDMNGVVHVLINNDADDLPDWGFTFDLNGGFYYQHGLELTFLPSGSYSTWSSIGMDDNDNNNGQKGDGDFDGIAKNPFYQYQGHGFIRTVTEAGVVQGAQTMFIDFAASKSFLSSVANNSGVQSKLNPDSQTWKVQFASILSANDHSALNYDIAGGQSLGGTIGSGSWSSGFIPVPEPQEVAFATALCLGFFVLCKRASIRRLRR